MWLVAEYQPTSLFSLKPASATSSGGRSLLVPTPFSIKMALLDAACRADGVRRAGDAWPALRDLTVSLRPPDRIVVTNLFSRVLRPLKRPPSADAPNPGALGRTIGYREYVHFGGPLGLALQGPGIALPLLGEWLAQVNYLGKRGGFMQLLGPSELVDDLPPGFLVLNGDRDEAFPAVGLIQQLDDCAPSLTFEKASIYSGKRITLGKERVLRHVVLPYRLVTSSRSFSSYERVSEAAKIPEATRSA